jgi:C-terminal processing protease CtpA/Prc
MDVHKIDTSAMHTAHASAAYHLLQDIPRPIVLNAVVPQLFACPGYGFVNVLLEVACEAPQSIEADAIPQVIYCAWTFLCYLPSHFDGSSAPCLCSTTLASRLISSASWYGQIVCHMSDPSQSKQVLAECSRASARGAAPPFRSASNANKILICAMQLGCGQYLMHSLSPLFASIFMTNGTGGGDLASITALTSSTATVRAGVADSAKIVAALDVVCTLYCYSIRKFRIMHLSSLTRKQVLGCIVNSITHAPMWLRCVCQHVFNVTCTSDDRGRARYACGGVLLLCGFCPAISNPEKFGLLPASVLITEASRQILRGISRALTILANGYDVNSADDGFMSLIRPSLEAAMPQYLSFLDQLMCSQHPAQISPLQPPIKVWRSQREDVSIVMRFSDRHAHRLRKSLAMRGHRRELLVLRHLLRAPRESLPILEPSPVFLAARPSMSNPGAMPWASLHIVQPRSNASAPKSRRSAVANGVVPQPAASTQSAPSNVSSTLLLQTTVSNSGRSIRDVTTHSTSSTRSDEVGVGIEVEVSPNGRVSVRRLENGGPAQRCGSIEVGDEIVAIDGQEVASVPNPMSVSALYLFGARGSRVTITLRRRGSAQPHSVTLLRSSPYNTLNLEEPSPHSAVLNDESLAQSGSQGSAPSHPASSKLYSTTTTSPKSLRFADGTATSDGHGGAPKRLRTCGVSFIKSNGIYVVKRARAGVIVPDNLKPGLQLLQVDGTSVADLSEVDVMQLLLGPDGSMCSLTLQNPLILSETITISLARSYRGGSKDGADASEDSDSSSSSVKSAATSATFSSVAGLASLPAADSKPQIPSSSGGLKSVYENLSMSLIGAATGRPPAARLGVQQVGIGVSFVPAPDGSGFVISKILPGSAASRSALAAGDYVVTIDGNSVGGIDLNELRSLITGDVDSVASIGYRQQGTGSVKYVKIKRATLDPLVMAAMSSQQAFSTAPSMARSHSPQSAGGAAMQSLYSNSQSTVSPDASQSPSDSSTRSGRAVISVTSAPVLTEAAPITQDVGPGVVLSPSSTSPAVPATVLTSAEPCEANEEWSGSESSGYASGMGILSDADRDGSDDDLGAAPLLQSPSKEIYQHPHQVRSALAQLSEPPPCEHECDSVAPTMHLHKLADQVNQQENCHEEPATHQQQNESLQLQSDKAFGEQERAIVVQSHEKQQPSHEQPSQKSLDDQDLTSASAICANQQWQLQQQPSLAVAAPLVSQESSVNTGDEGHEDGTAAKFVFIASFGLTLCEDGRGYWYISAKVGDNRLPALLIGDVIRTVSDNTARGWVADKMCASLDKGGVEIGIQRGLTAAMRFVSLPVADVTGSQTAVAPVTRHGLGFAFRRNEDSGALVVTGVRDGSAAALCCLEVGDILLEVTAKSYVSFALFVTRKFSHAPI